VLGVVTVSEATPGDVASWLEIAREAEPLFGPMPDFESVLVDTFGEDSIDGYPARRLYESFGFVPSECLPDGPEGGSRQRFRLRRRVMP
jgi:hypothetical protein